MNRFEQRLARLEQQCEDAEEALSIRVCLTGPEEEPYPREPGMQTLHVELSGPSWWGEVDEAGIERWVRNA